VDGDGYYYYTIRLIDNELDVVHHKRTNLEVKDGWNYVALYVEEVYEYSYIKMYNRYENMPTAEGWDDFQWQGLGVNYAHKKFLEIIPGYYNEKESVSNDQHVIVLGCKTERDTSDANQDGESPFGLCMQGWLQYISMESSNHRTGDMTNEAGHAAIEALTETGGVFQPVPLITANPTMVLPGNNKAAETRVFAWDGAIPTTNDVYKQEAIVNTHVSPHFSCEVQLAGRKDAEGKDMWTPYF